MKRMTMMWLVLGLLAPVWTFGGEDAAVVEPLQKEGMAMVRVGAVDEALAERARLFAEENLHMRVEMLPPQELKGESLDDAGRSVSGLADRKYAGLIVLAAPEGTIGAHGVSLLEERVVVVNVKALEPQDGDGEKFGRRLERAVMRSAGMLMGLQACPNPQCALWSYSTVEQLDETSRNFCPPCQEKFMEMMKEKNVTEYAAPVVE